MKPNDLQKMDLDNLDELIAKCEDSMVHPFKKKKEPPMKEEMPMEMEEEGEEKPDLSEVDMEELLRMYQDLKEDKE